MAELPKDEKPEETAVPISAITAQLLMGQSKSSAEEIVGFEDLQDPGEGKNKMAVVCGFCKCKIMRPGIGTLVEKEIFLPNMTEKYKIGTEPEGDLLKKFWVIDDMMKFENVGFSKTVDDTVKFLLCADCEVGPIGWHHLSNRQEFFLSAERVKYASS